MVLMVASDLVYAESWYVIASGDHKLLKFAFKLPDDDISAQWSRQKGAITG